MTGREVGKEMAGDYPGRLFLALVLSFSLFPAAPATSQDVPGHSPGPHSHFRRPESCRRCHAYRQSVPEKDRFLPDADGFCLECHLTEGLGVTHPRNVRPGNGKRRMEVPEDLRLDSEGRVFCLTCHTAHGPFLSPVKSFAAQEAANPDAPAGEKPAYRTFFARRSDPVRGFAPLCEGCHGKR